MSFAIMGQPVWMGYFIGTCELLGAIGLWIRKLSFYAAAGLIFIMCGAVYFHVRFDAVANAIPAIVLSGFLVNILLGRAQDRFRP